MEQAGKARFVVNDCEQQSNSGRHQGATAAHANGKRCDTPVGGMVAGGSTKDRSVMASAWGTGAAPKRRGRLVVWALPAGHGALHTLGAAVQGPVQRPTAQGGLRRPRTYTARPPGQSAPAPEPPAVLSKNDPCCSTGKRGQVCRCCRSCPACGWPRILISRSTVK